jgi:hypothetical protein
MPQGLKGASASFSKLCRIIFRHIPNIITYLDDLIGATTTHTKTIALLNKVFAECRFHRMKLNLTKMSIWTGKPLEAKNPPQKAKIARRSGFFEKSFH